MNFLQSTSFSVKRRKSRSMNNCNFRTCFSHPFIVDFFSFVVQQSIALVAFFRRRHHRPNANGTFHPSLSPDKRARRPNVKHATTAKRTFLLPGKGSLLHRDATSITMPNTAEELFVSAFVFQTAHHHRRYYTTKYLHNNTQCMQ